MPLIRYSNCLIIGLLLCAAPMASGQVPADPALEMWKAQRNTFESYIRNMKLLDRQRIEQVMDLGVENRFLVLRTPLNNIPAEESMRANFEGISGLAMVSVLREDSDRASAEPQRFNLTVMDFPAPKQTVTISLGLMGPNQFTLSKSMQTTNGPFFQVIFTQTKVPLSTGGGSVSLVVTQSHAQGIAPETLNVEGPDFATFVREHADETDRYLRPIFRELGQESVFAPDPTVAWQVFSDAWKPDPISAKRVQEILPSLDATDYRVRDAALRSLEDLGRDGAVVLIHLDRAHLTPEQNARIDRALSPFAQLSARDAARMRSDPGFLLDCLYSPDGSLRKAALDRLRGTVPGIEFDLDASLQARSAAIDALRPRILALHPQVLP